MASLKPSACLRRVHPDEVRRLSRPYADEVRRLSRPYAGEVRDTRSRQPMRLVSVM